MTREDIIRMAREAGAKPSHNPEEWDIFKIRDTDLERFAALVAAHEREKVARWMMERGYATGHGDTIQDLIKEVEWQAKEKEREECAKIANAWQTDVLNPQYHCDCATAIRARGEK
jgi:hypothetical protein